MLRPPKHIEDAIRRVFPMVKLVWWRKGRRWALISLAGRNLAPIHLYQPNEKPTMKNTLGLLRAASIAHLKNRWDVDEWLWKNVDSKNDKIIQEGREKLQEASHEAAKRMIFINKPSISIVNPWGRKK